MKKIKLSIILISAIALAAFACTSNDAPKNTGAAPESANTAGSSIDKQTYKVIGVIKNIDVESGKVTIAHEDIPGYMSAMEMTEAVSDKSILTNLKVGDKVDFEIERTGSKVVIIKLNKSGENMLSKGAEIYQANCAECHGANGEGAKKGISLVSGHALHHSEAEHLKQVTNGEDDKMPAFRDKISVEEIKQVVAYVRNDLQKDIQRQPSHQHKH